MAYGRIAHEYRKNAVNGASPLQLVIMLYDGALRFIESGKHSMAHQDFVRQNDQLQRAQNIILELMSCLDMQQGGDVAKNLLAIYTYVLEELVRGNCEDKPERLDRCMKILRDLRESWVAIDGQGRSAGEAIAA